MPIYDAITSRFRRTPRVAVIRLYGAIGAGGLSGGGLSDSAVAGLIERAFRMKPVAVALSINSPGGSATQSALIAARIRRLSAEHKVPVHAFCEDVAASGGYWLATAGDDIHADANSIIGSIGVIFAGFGVPELISRWGVERRVHTAGQSKSMLDPFRPEKAEDVARLRTLLDAVHANFIAHVKERRAGRLVEEDLFTGEVWVGRQAVEKGLIDGIGHLVPVMKAKYGEKVRFAVVSPRRSLFQRLGLPGAAEAAGAVMAAAEERALWARYGL